MILFFTILVILSIYIYKTPINKANTKVIALVFAVMAFFQEVNSDSDLMTAFYHLDKLRQDGWQYFYSGNISESFYFNGRDLLKVYFYILSFLPYNNFYSAISVFLIYYLSLISVLKTCHYYHTSIVKTKYLFILLIWMIDFYDGSNGVRNMLAFSIFVHTLVNDCFYAKTKIRKVWVWCLYIASAMLHSAAWALIIIRLLVSKTNSKRFLIIVGMILVAWPITLQYILPSLGTINNSIFKAIIHSITAYTTEGQSQTGNFDIENFNNSTSYILMRYFRLIHILLILYMFYLTRSKFIKPTSLPKFIFLLSGFCIGTAFSNVAGNVLSRYSFALIFLTPIFYAYYNTIPIRKKKLEKIEICALYLLGITMLFNYYMFRYHYHYMHFGLTIY